MQIKTTSFSDNASLPDRFTCRGENISPVLSLENVPTEAKSLALIMHDPDAVDGDFTHWLVWNIEPTTKQVLEDSAPTGSQVGTNDFGRIDYGGPCPPKGSGTHRYIFELYALSATLDLPPTTMGESLRAALKDKVLATTTLTGLMSAEAQT
jgi:Raf kinase inhibitor-like YbhB/YbcL family protein